MPEWLFQLGAYAVIAGAAYGAIRTDLQGLHDKAATLRDSVSKAHARIDDHINMHHVRGQ